MFSTRISSSRVAVSLLALISLAAFTPSTSRAATVSATYNFPSFTIAGFQSTVSNDFSVNVLDFNPALGTLNSIGVAVSMTLQATATQTSGTPSGGISFGGGGGGGPFFNSQGFEGISLNVDGATPQLDKPVTVSDTEGSTVTFISAVNISPSDFNGAIGTGTVAVTYPYNGSLSGATTLSDVSETFSGNVKISYNYTPSSAAVPLPKSLTMSLLGFAMLASLRLLKMAKDSRRLA